MTDALSAAVQSPCAWFFDMLYSEYMFFRWIFLWGGRQE